jgi:LacI family transcriptional regulator
VLNLASEEPKRKPSSWDIAREAGVSQSTVSRVLNNSPRISEATSQRVKEAMARLGYAPNAAARTLTTGRSNLIGLVVSNITNPFYPEVIEAIVATAAQEEYNVVLCNAQENWELQSAHLELLIEHQVDGAILTSSLLDSELRLAKMALDRIPLVMVNRTVNGLSVDSVHLDNTEAGRIVARHLAKLGHRCFGFVGGRQETSTDTQRLGGFRQALTELGLELPPEHVVHGAFTYESGYASARHFIALSDRPSALFCANDVIALGVMDAVYDAGLRIPQDVAIVGVDDVAAASLRPLGLTTVRQPAAEMGRRAVQLLLERLRDGRQGEPLEIVLRPKLIVRRTCGALAAGQNANSWIEDYAHPTPGDSRS